MNERDQHTHETASRGIELYSGGHYEHCSCGAVRKIKHDGRPDVGRDDDSNGWHTCKLCTPGFYKNKFASRD